MCMIIIIIDMIIYFRHVEKNRVNGKGDHFNEIVLCIMVVVSRIKFWKVEKQLKFST